MKLKPSGHSKMIAEFPMGSGKGAHVCMAQHSILNAVNLTNCRKRCYYWLLPREVLFDLMKESAGDLQFIMNLTRKSIVGCLGGVCVAGLARTSQTSLLLLLFPSHAIHFHVLLGLWLRTREKVLR